MEFALTIIIGLILVVLGISQMRGNISSLHSYHTHKVKEEDRLPLGKRTGLGSIIIGLSIIANGLLMHFSAVSNNSALFALGMVILLVGLLVGTVIALRAIIQYNHGLF